MEAMPRGRPPEDGVKRTKKIEVRATPDQLDRWDAAAAHAGEDRSEWVRRVLDDAAERETRGPRPHGRTRDVQEG